MKKFSFLSVAAVAMTAVVLFVSCQKEQSTAVAEQPNLTNEGTVTGSMGVASYSGSIASTYAAALAANYAKKYDDDKQVQYVAFSAKDLIAFLNGLQTKYKSDLIYVNFGVYGKGALPVNSKDYGKLTVFFTGNKIPAPNATKKTDGVDEISSSPDQFLNHGTIYP